MKHLTLFLNRLFEYSTMITNNKYLQPNEWIIYV